MRPLLVLVSLAWLAPAQTEATGVEAAAAAPSLQPRDGEEPLRCYVQEIKPKLNFGLRFQTGFLVEIPLVQYSGSGHSWKLVLGVTPEESGQPVYLTDHLELPPILRQEFTGQTTGAFVVGEGRYRVQLAVSDDENRVCRKDWRIEAARSREERSVRIAIPPHTVGDLSFVESAAVAPHTESPRRVTVLLNSSRPYQVSFYPRPLVTDRGVMLTPLTPLAGDFIVDFRSALTGILAAVIEKLAGWSVRLVVFDLDLQRETLFQNDFKLDQIDKASHATNDPNRWAIDYHALQNQTGRWGLLNGLLQREIQSPVRSSLILVAGARNGSTEKAPADFRQVSMPADQRVAYLQYNPFRDPVYTGIPAEMARRAPAAGADDPWDPVQGTLGSNRPDLIDLLVRRLKGKTFRLFSPVDFAKAMEAVRK